MGSGQEAIVRPPLHDVAEIDEERAGDHGRGQPLPAGKAHGESGGILTGEHGDERVVGVGPLAELLVVVDLLGRVVQEAQVDVRLVLEVPSEVAGWHVERPREQGQGPLAHRLHGLEVGDHGRAHRVVALGPLVAPAQRRARHHVGMPGTAVVADEEALVVVRARGLVHLGGALDGLVDGKIADVVLVDLERELFLERHGVELARSFEGGLHCRGGDAVAGEVEEAHALARLPHLGRHRVEAAGLAQKCGREVDHGNGPGRFLEILDRHGLEDVHRRSLRFDFTQPSPRRAPRLRLVGHVSARTALSSRTAS